MSKSITLYSLEGCKKYEKLLGFKNSENKITKYDNLTVVVLHQGVEEIYFSMRGLLG